MSTLSPNHSHDSIMKASTSSSTSKTTKTTTTAVNMAVPHTTKPKATSAKAKSNAASGTTDAGTKQKSTQMHRRSRTGCYTCRLRRKKCDEGLPLCTACKHLGLTCEYKRPQWWGNNEARRSQKDDIKLIIKRKKLSEKSAAPSLHHTTTTTLQASSVASTPPGLSHSLPTSATFSDPLDRTRSASIDSYNFNSPPATSDYGFGAAAPATTTCGGFVPPQMHPDFMFGNGVYAPYEVDIKTERKMFVNDVPTLSESTTSTFSTFQSPPLPPCNTVLPAFPMDACAAASGVAIMDPMVDPALTAATGDVVGFGVGGVGVGVGVDVHGNAMFGGGEWTEQVYLERSESLTEETLGANAAGFTSLSSDDACATATTTGSDDVLVLTESDEHLLDHFVHSVLPTVFPVLETSRPGAVGADVILPALQNNRPYLHCCLAIAAQHLEAAMTPEQRQQQRQAGICMDQEIMRHRFATIRSLCLSMPCVENNQQVLEATLGMIFFQSCVGLVDDALPDVPWLHHLKPMVDLVEKLGLPALVTGLAAPEEMQAQAQAQASSPVPSSQDAGAVDRASATPTAPTTPFSMTMTSWIDILGSAMQGWAPQFAHTYREKHLSAPHASSLGLRELMGCEDRVMYLISEIACLEALKDGGMDDIVLCQHVSVLGDQIGLTEVGEATPQLPFNANGSLNAAQLSKNITAAFRLAARVYLCSLVPGFRPAQASCVGLVDKLTAVLQTIPCGPRGFDRCVSWVYLMAGASSLPGASFRAFFEDRVQQLGDGVNVGSFGRVVRLLREVWLQQEMFQQQQQQTTTSSTSAPLSPEQAVGSPLGGAGQQYVHWRDVMQAKGWSYLLI